MTSSSAPLIDIERITVALPSWAERHYAVEDVSLAVRRNEILCVVGESGSGKSLMARSILGLLPGPNVRCTGGRIMFEGENLVEAGAARMRQIRGGRIAMIFQEPMTALNPLMKIGRQIDEMIEIHRDIATDARRARMIEVLRDVRLPEPERILHAYPHEISGGQRQRVMIAMALALDPAILIADEPTTALDVTTQAQILLLIRELQERRQTGVMFITHDFGVVAEIADRVAVMQRGRLVELGEADQVLNHPQHAYTRELIGAVPSLTPRPSGSPSDAPVVLEVKTVDKTFGSSGLFFGRTQRRIHAIKSVSLTLRRGDTLGLVGESGSGKSTLARCINRLVDADSGSVLLSGIDLMKLSRREMRVHRRRIQMVFQDPFGSLNPRLRIGAQIADGPIARGVARDDAIAAAKELLAVVGLDPRAVGRFPHEFSGGQRQRIAIARALAMQPDILVADEPVSALDVSVQAQVLELLSDIRRRFDLTMLFITHDLRVAAQVCDAVAVMRNGEIVEHGPTAEVFANARHPYTRELLDAVPGRHWTPPVATA